MLRKEENELDQYVIKSLEEEFSKKIQFGKELLILNKNLENKKQEQSYAIAKLAVQRFIMRKKIKKLQNQQVDFRQSMLRERKLFENEHERVKSRIMDLVSKDSARENIKTHKEVDEKISNLMESKNTNYEKYQQALKPLHERYTKSLMFFRKKMMPGFLKWNKIQTQVYQNRGQLSQLIDKKIDLENKLGIKQPLNKAKILPFFGGQAKPILAARQAQLNHVFIKAVDAGKFTLAQHLLWQGASINACYTDTHQTALSTALINQDVKKVQWLIQQGADVKQELEFKVGDRPITTTPLIFVIRYWNDSQDAINVLDLIIEKNVDINILVRGEAALHWAAYQGRLSFVEYLLNHDADINLVNGDKRTPLQDAELAERKHNRPMLPKIRALLEPKKAIAPGGP